MKKKLMQLKVFCTALCFISLQSVFGQQDCQGSLEFDATNTAVRMPLNNQYYSGANGGFTWECWFKLSSPLGNAPRPLISAVDSVMFDDIYLGFGWTGGYFNAPLNTLIFRVDPPSSGTPVDPNCSYVPTSGFVVGRWYHAAGVIDYNKKLKYLYVNGILVDTKPATKPPITRVIQTNLSACKACSSINSLDGRMDEVRIWDRVLSASEIGTWYNQCRAGTEPNFLAYYRCNQIGALNVLDATANVANGNFLNNIPSWSTDNCPVSGANCNKACSCLGSLDFDASNDAVQLPPNNQYYSGNGYTWECWFKLKVPLGNIDRPLISAVDWTVFEDMYFGFGWHGGYFNTGNDTLVFRVEGPSSAPPTDLSCTWAPSGGFLVGRWYHAAGVADYAAGQKYLYVNGVLVDTKPLTVAPNTRVIQTNLSACDGCSAAYTNDSKMDEVRIWDRALTASEIAAWYDKCRAGTEPNLLVYYRANQVGAASVIDGSPNGNTGTFRNAIGWSNENAPITGTCLKDCNDSTETQGEKALGMKSLFNYSNTLIIYPNPASGSVKVASKLPGNLALYTITGQLVSETKVTENVQEIKLDGYKAGVYLYIFKTKSNTESGKLIIE